MWHGESEMLPADMRGTDLPLLSERRSLRVDISETLTHGGHKSQLCTNERAQSCVCTP